MVEVTQNKWSGCQTNITRYNFKPSTAMVYTFSTFKIFAKKKKIHQYSYCEEKIILLNIICLFSKISPTVAYI